jgi:hypothetical protein
MMHPHPRAYTDWKVPEDEFGNDIGVCTNSGVYKRYLEWLADYLYTTDIPVPAAQAEFVADCKKKGGAEHAVWELSDQLGYSIWETELIQEISASGRPFSEHHAAERATWSEMSAEEKEGWTEQDYFTSEAEYVRLGEEFRESQKIPAHIRHADIPYRPILAALFKEIPNSTRRYELLDAFYRNFNECTLK